jgi:hypothetical protein
MRPEKVRRVWTILPPETHAGRGLLSSRQNLVPLARKPFVSSGVRKLGKTAQEESCKISYLQLIQVNESRRKYGTSII